MNEHVQVAHGLPSRVYSSDASLGSSFRMGRLIGAECSQRGGRRRREDGRLWSCLPIPKTSTPAASVAGATAET
jgi:hypothetical protein